MAAGRYSFTVEVGAAFAKTLHVYVGVDIDGVPIPRDMTGFDALLQARKTTGSPTVLWELSVAAGTITFGGVGGDILLEDTAGNTDLLSWLGRAYYDMLISPVIVGDDDTERLLEGRIALSPPVTIP